jgi:hypothetical protein
MNDPICNERGIPQSECPPFCPHDFGAIGPDGFTRLADAVAKVTPCSCSAQRARADAAEAENHNLRADLDRCEERLWRLAAIAGWRPGNPADNNATAELWIADALAGESRCPHEWLDRPESDTRECLICGTEVAG